MKKSSVLRYSLIAFLFTVSLYTVDCYSNEVTNETYKPNVGLGINFGFGPAILGLDFEKNSFYAFGSGSVLLPFVTYGSVGAFSIGAGPSIKLSKISKWKFDILGIVSPGWNYNFLCGFGIGVGFHATFDSGFTVGFKLPFFGVAVGGYSSFIPTMVGNFYLMSFGGMPIISFGYRF